MSTTKLTKQEIEAVKKQIDILKGFKSEYANEMIELYTRLLKLYA